MVHLEISVQQILKKASKYPPGVEPWKAAAEPLAEATRLLGLGGLGLARLRELQEGGWEPAAAPAAGATRLLDYPPGFEPWRRAAAA